MGTVAGWFAIVIIATAVIGHLAGGTYYDANEGEVRTSGWLRLITQAEVVAFILTMLVMSIRERRR